MHGLPRPQPPDAGACCGGGCSPCVWDRYNDELQSWEMLNAEDRYCGDGDDLRPQEYDAALPSRLPAPGFGVLWPADTPKDMWERAKRRQTARRRRPALSGVTGRERYSEFPVLRRAHLINGVTTTTQTADDGPRTVLRVELNMATIESTDTMLKSRIDALAGAVAGIVVPNDPAAVQGALAWLGVEGLADTPFVLADIKGRPRTVPAFLPAGITPTVALSQYLGIHLPAPAGLVAALGMAATAAVERDQLNALLTEVTQLSSPRAFPSFVDLMQNYPSCKPGFTFAHLLAFAPQCEPRYFSLCNNPRLDAAASAAENSFTLELCMRVWPNSYCSSWLLAGSRRFVPPSVPLFLRPPTDSHFALSHNLSRPMIMLATGLGAGALRSLLSALEQRRTMAASPEVTVIIGVRSSEEVIYRSDFASWQESGLIRRLVIACSQVQPKQYVQDVLRTQSTAVIRTLCDQGGRMLVCGFHSLTESITGLLAQLLVQENRCQNLERGSEIVQCWRRMGALAMDVWQPADER